MNILKIFNERATFVIFEKELKINIDKVAKSNLTKIFVVFRIKKITSLII